MSHPRFDTLVEKIRQKRKTTPWRDYVREIASWRTFSVYRRDGQITRYPDASRVGKQVSAEEFTVLQDALPSREYRSDKSFFDQMYTLIQIIPWSRLAIFLDNENIHFSDEVFGAKNTYLSLVVGVNAENIAHSWLVYSDVRNVFDCLMITDGSENVFNSFSVTKSFHVFYCRWVHNSANIWLSRNMVGCHDCILCDGLENQSYCIRNQQLSKEEYALKKTEILQDKARFMALFQSMGSHLPNSDEKSTGNNIRFCDNVENGETLAFFKDSRNVVFGSGGDGGAADIYDCADAWINSYHMYGCASVGENDEHIYLSYVVGRSQHIYYSQHIVNCSFCFGCIGLKNKSYCIFNKPYEKEEWYSIVTEILEGMERDGTFGSMFPPQMNPFYFNDTFATLLDPSFTRDEVTSLGYLWRDEVQKPDIPEWTQSVNARDLWEYEGFDQNGKWSLDASILEKAIVDEKWNAWRVIPMEYDFLVKHALPLPRLHWSERMRQSFRNPQ